MKNRFLPWLYGEQDVMDRMAENVESPDMTRSELKKITRSVEEEYKNRPDVLEAIGRSRSRFRRLYLAVALISCVALTLVLLYTISLMPRYGEENPRTKEVVSRYVEEGLQETGAVNIVSGMILDYRAFDTLGESHVLFTALVCVLILLRIDTKNQMTGYEDYYTVRTDSYFDLSGDPILRLVCAVIIPCVLLYGIYIILNGQNSPGGGFSGGAVLGAGLILFSTAFGFDKVDRLFSLKVSNIVTFVSLAYPSAGYSGRVRGRVYDVRILQPVPQGKCRRTVMISNLLEHYEEAAAIILFAIGFSTLLFHRNLIKKLIGMNIMDTGTFLLLASMGYIRGRRAPIIENGVQEVSAYINPVPAGLVLTGIVVSVSVTAVMLSLTVRLYKRYHTLDLDAIYMLSRHEKEDR